MNTLKPIILLASIFTINALAAQPGCTDPLATNYNPLATQNDGSCVYAAATVNPASGVNLPAIMLETSGLIFWNNWLWTHNDNTDNHLYAFDANAVNLYVTFTLTGTVNNDWEEISQDDDYVYIGDFGNNENGNRTNLKILRVEKSSLLLNAPIIDTISFAYADQTDFSPTGANNTDFDCEAFIVSSDSIYLFTKQWISKKTALYVLPKTPGNYMAQYKDTLDVQGLITGALLKADDSLIALCGYSATLQPFVYLLYDFECPRFFHGNKRKININLSMHQVEGITTNDGLTYYLTNEKFAYQSTTVLAKFLTFDFSPYLFNYINGGNVAVYEPNNSQISCFTNPATNTLSIQIPTTTPHTYTLTFTNIQGQLLISEHIEIDQTHTLDLSEFPNGIYFLSLRNDNANFVSKVVVWRYL